MADERLRFGAEVTDRFTGPLGQLETSLRRVAGVGSRAGKDLQKDFDAFHGTLGKTQGALQGITPLLSGMGVAGLGAGLGLGAISSALRGFSTSTQQLSILSKETGVAVDQLRAFGSLGERFGVSADTMQGGVRKFSEEMSRLRKRYGETYSSLQAMNLGDLVEKLVSAPNMKVALDTAMDALSNIGDPVRRRKVAEQLFGADQFGAIAGQLPGRVGAVLAEIERRQGQTTDAQVRAAKRFEDSLSNIREKMDGLRTEALAPLLEELSSLVDKFSTPEALASFSDQLKEIGKFARTTAQEFEAIIQTYKRFKEFIGLGDPSKNKEFQPGPDGGRLVGPSDPANRARLEGRKFSLEQQRELLDRNPNAPDYQRKRDRMTDELKRVGDELEKLRSQGAATAQPSSFGSAPTGGGLIHKAAFGGVGGFGGGFGTSGGPLVPGGGYGGVGVGRPPSIFPSPPARAIGGTRGLPSVDGPLAAKYPDGLAAGIKQSAKDLGIRAEDLATVISYETAGTFDKWKRGPTTKWGTHRGLIQWGEPQAKKYGVTADMSAGEQMQAVTRYLRDRGVRPGMGIHQVYGAINAGGVSDWHLKQRDGAAGGAPGDVRDKVDFQMAGHRRKGVALLGGDRTDLADSSSPAAAGERSGDEMMKRLYGEQAPVAKAPPQEHRMTIDLNGFPSGARARTSMGDLFRETTVSKSRQMETL